MPNTQHNKSEIEQMAEVQGVLNDPKKLILYGFGLGLKAENSLDGLTLSLPPTGEKTAVV